jgi:hypothetical protein
LPTAKPTFLITGGMRDPEPSLFALSINKAAQYNFGTSLFKTFGPQGVHVATVIVGGVVSDEEKINNPRAVAENFWKLYSQNRAEWKRDIDMTI